MSRPGKALGCMVNERTQVPLSASAHLSPKKMNKQLETTALEQLTSHIEQAHIKKQRFESPTITPPDMR